MGYRESVFAGAAGLAALAGAAQAEPSVQFEDAAARVVVIPENRSDVKVEIVSTHPDLPLQVRTRGERVVVDGGLKGRNRNCARGFGPARVKYEDLPEVVVRTPMDARVAAGGAVFGSVGRSARLELSNYGCGAWTVANVAGELKINQAGVGSVRAGRSASLVARMAGAGSISTGPVAGPAHIDTAGSGDVRAASIDGPLKANIAGSGNVRIDSGAASEVSVRIAGSGDVLFGGEAGRVSAFIAGSGDVRVRRITGPVSKTVAGSGNVVVGG